MKFLQIKLTFFLFLLKECILCHVVFGRHYALYFFAQWGTVLGPQLSEHLENGQIRNLSAVDSHVEVWVKSISSLEMFLVSVVWEEGGEAEVKGEIINV